MRESLRDQVKTMVRENSLSDLLLAVAHYVETERFRSEQEFPKTAAKLRSAANHIGKAHDVLFGSERRREINASLAEYWAMKD